MFWELEQGELTSPDAEQGQTSPPDVPVFEEMDSVGHVADLIEQEQRNVHQQDPDKDEAGHLHLKVYSQLQYLGMSAKKQRSKRRG